ncbi:hypothetical protein GCM10018962_16740 [Dactylosporangium matsuzakiense]|uniref:Uncharacterized protein n=1 Tax=Dactylosporangium matsuzakiense TaxID=53360 RepID=A0A9W6NM01_9ACTN|nr:hypothetical protein GCM10017581_036310 [Dactylosporangium matsuzakiense]
MEEGFASTEVSARSTPTQTGHPASFHRAPTNLYAVEGQARWETSRPALRRTVPFPQGSNPPTAAKASHERRPPRTQNPASAQSTSRGREARTCGQSAPDAGGRLAVGGAVRTW